MPILISVTDAAGKQIYTNATVGASSPTGEISLIGAHATVWWVDANVLVAGATATHVSARIGAGDGAAGAGRRSIEVTASGQRIELHRPIHRWASDQRLRRRERPDRCTRSHSQPGASSRPGRA